MKKATKSSNWLIKDISETELKTEKALAKISVELQMKRLEMKMDQKQFAKYMGVSQGMVSRWESGEYNFTIATLVGICEKTGLSFDPGIMPKEPALTDGSRGFVEVVAVNIGGIKNFDNWVINDKFKEGYVA